MDGEQLGSPPAPTRMVAVTVGTDHHRFDRLMTWVEQWMPTAADVHVVAQHGPARCPEGATGHAVLPHAAFLELLTNADVVVTQGGPSTIMEALAVGRRPLAVPRLRRFDEVVDDHQVAFCHRLQAAGLVRVAETSTAFNAELDAMLADPARARAHVTTSHVADTIGLVGRLIDQLVVERGRTGTRPVGWRRWRVRLRSRGAGTGSI